MRVLVAWSGGLFLTEGEIEVLSVSSLFLTRVRMYVGVGDTRTRCVYAHTHTHTAQMGYSVVSPGVGMRHLEGPKNPDGLNLSIHIFTHVYKVHMYLLCTQYMLGGGMRSWTNCFFL